MANGQNKNVVVTILVFRTNFQNVNVSYRWNETENFQIQLTTQMSSGRLDVYNTNSSTSSYNLNNRFAGVADAAIYMKARFTLVFADSPLRRPLTYFYTYIHTRANTYEKIIILITNKTDLFLHSHHFIMFDVLIIKFVRYSVRPPIRMAVVVTKYAQDMIFAHF